MTKRALITGITGQDGSYLAELLLAKGYEVHGLIRRSSSFNTGRIDHIYEDPHADRPPSDAALRRPSRRRRPGQPAARRSSRTRSTTWARRATSGSRSTCPTTPATSPASATVQLLEAIRAVGLETRFYQASSSEMFGATPPAAERGDAVPPALAVRRREGLRLLDHAQLPRGVRHVRGQRHPVQPRVAAPRRDVRDPQDHPRGRADQGGAAGPPLPRQPRRGPRLGLRPGVRRGHVADAAGRRADGLRGRDRDGVLGAGLRGARRSGTRTWTGASTCGSTSATCARPRWTR